MRFFKVVFFILFGLFSCKSDQINSIDTSKIDIDFQIKRYDVDFYNASLETLPKLKKKYPLLFPTNFTDSLAIAKINDKDEQELFKETQNLYSNITVLENQLTSLFKHVKYYNPKFKSPNIITMLTNIDYNSRTIYADSLLLISLDVYLGKDHQFYSDYPKYIKENNTRDNIIVDVANSIINKQLVNNQDRSFIGKVVFEGKKMYLLDMYLPSISDKLKIGYEQAKLDWVITNEEEIWKYFIERKMLFSTDAKLDKRFIDIAPFSKFYLQDDNLSPGRVGTWLGWQIVKSYMKHNDVSLHELIDVNSLDLFNKSKYKPKK